MKELLPKIINQFITKSFIQFSAIILFLNLSYPTSISAQDTLIVHYQNATISEVFLDESGTGAITGKGDDLSQGKFMFFDSEMHASPVTELVEVLMDIVISDYSKQDSFIVYIERVSNSNWSPIWERKFSFSDISEESIPISNNEVAKYNFRIDMTGENVGNIGSFQFNIGIKYDYETNAKIAFRATGDGEYLGGGSRCFTINEDGSIKDFASQYGVELGLAIFPITLLSGSIEDLTDLGIEIINTQDNILAIHSASHSKNLNLSLHNSTGILLYENKLHSGTSLEINTSAFPTGIYILSLSNNHRRGTAKIILP